MEYPSDSWAHYQRITRFGNISLISSVDEEIQRKFYYLWEWSVLSLVPMAQRKPALDFLSAFSQILLLVQVYRFSLRLGFNSFWRWFSLLFFAATYGYSVFSVRYYGISTTNIAYAFYLYVLEGCLSVERVSFRKVAGIGAAILLLYYNHKPEFAFSLLAVFFTLFIYLIRKRFTEELIKGTVLLIVVLVVLPGFFGFSVEDFSLSAQAQRYLLVGLPYFLAPVAVVAVFKEVPVLIYILTWLPFLTFASPIFENQVRQYVNHPVDVLRLYWIFPSGFVWCLLAKKCDGFLKIARLHILTRIVLCFIVLLIGFSPKRPWRGKLWFQFHKADPSRELADTYHLAEWINKNRDFKLSEEYLADDSTMYALNAHLGWQYPHNRIKPPRLTDKFKSQRAFDSWFRGANPKFALLPVPFLLRKAGKSHVGELLNWPSNFGDRHSEMSETFEKTIDEALDKKGWTRTLVPPHYMLIEPPRGTASR